MKRSIITVSAAALLTISLSTGNILAAGSPPTPPKAVSVRVLSVIAPKAVSKTKQVVTVHVRVTGIKLDPTHIGRKNVAGHGHMQLYLDRIPSSAYKKPSLSNVVAVAAGPIFSFSLSSHWLKAARGHHHFIVALAQNNEVLYHGGTSSFTLTVK